jgi:hypothetical protein
MRDGRSGGAGRVFLLALFLLVPLVSPGSAEDDVFWGDRLAGTPKHYIFGYGSLVNSESRRSTAGRDVPAVPARISADLGYLRSWNFRSPSGFTALGLRKAGPGESGATVNGVVYAVDGDSMEEFDRREAGYTRVPVPRDKIEAAGWQPVPPDGEIWMYVPNGPGWQPGVGLSLADEDFPILQSYVDVVVTGALEYGVDFAEELLDSTYGWSEYWLNDRDLPRRPWVFQKRWQEIDQLLANFPDEPGENSFAARKMPERYAVYFIDGAVAGKQ